MQFPCSCISRWQSQLCVGLWPGLCSRLDQARPDIMRRAWHVPGMACRPEHHSTLPDACVHVYRYGPATTRPPLLDSSPNGDLPNSSYPYLPLCKQDVAKQALSLYSYLNKAPIQMFQLIYSKAPSNRPYFKVPPHKMS
jgi:hypothetical protein